MTNQQESSILLTMKGTTLLVVSTAKHDNNQKAHQILNEVCKRIALNRFGKSAMQIKNDLLQMSDEEVPVWLNSIWDKYICDKDIIEIWKLFANVTFIN